MLRLVLGRSSEEKLNMYAEEMKELVNSDRRVIAIVPDQFSFEFDKLLYTKLGAKAFNRVSVVSFKKLSQELISRLGTGEGTLLKFEERISLMYLALRKVRADNSLDMLSRYSRRPGFVSEMSGIFDSFIRSGIAPEALNECSLRLTGNISRKLRDTATVYSAYLGELKRCRMRDESSLVSIGASLAHDSSYFKDAYVYIDRFDSYSKDELSVIEAAVKDSAIVSISIALPKNYHPNPVSVYAITYDTQKKLVALAADNNTSLLYVYANDSDDKSDGIRAITTCLEGAKSKADLTDGSVKVFSALNIYEEAEFVAAQIRKLVSSGSYTYNDIAIVAGDIRYCSAALESSLQRFDVPYYIDGKQRALDMSCTIFALSAIDAASSVKPDTEKILKLVRSPFSGLDDEEISLIEDYCLRWNVDKDMWLSSFSGRDADTDIDRINSIRRRIIEPLEQLRSGCRSASAKRICTEFNKYIDSSGLAKRAGQIIEECSDADRKIISARLFKQLWKALMSAIAAVYSTLGDEQLTLSEFGGLMKLILAESGIANPPQKLCGVNVYEASRSIISAPKAAFVIGLNEGKFPQDVRRTGIFSGRDMSALSSEGLVFDMCELERLNSERFDCFRAMTCPLERLYAVYSEADTAGHPMRPSVQLRKLMHAFSVKPVSVHSLPAAFYCTTPMAAYYRYSLEKDKQSGIAVSLKMALKEIDEYRIKLERDEMIGRESKHSLSPAVARSLFAPHDINVTPSRIDSYNKCGFEYFMRYGLGLRQVTPIAVDPAGRGSIMHFIFERILGGFKDTFMAMSDEELLEHIRRLLEEYNQGTLGGGFGKTAKFRADYKRLENACFDILVNIREEYKVSEFRPVRFEYSLSDDLGCSIFSIPVSSGLKVNLRGVVDRVDCYRSEGGREYIRILDYKTGFKELRLDELYNGLNLQMLLYMLALTQGSDNEFSSCTPAGILYMRAGYLECTEDYSDDCDTEGIREKRAAVQLKRSGIIVGDDASIAAMDKSFSGLYAPVTKRKDGSYTSRSSVISEKSFKLLEEFAKRKTIEFADGLLSGKISSIPCARDVNRLSCSYCDYKTVCDRRKHSYKLIDSSDSDRLMEQIGYKEDN